VRVINATVTTFSRVNASPATFAPTIDDDIEELAELAEDRSQGDNRLVLLIGLRNSKTAIARQALEELKSDPALAK
jgi:hypothetical protein